MKPDLVFIRWRGRSPQPRRPRAAADQFQQSWIFEQVEESCDDHDIFKKNFFLPCY